MNIAIPIRTLMHLIGPGFTPAEKGLIGELAADQYGPPGLSAARPGTLAPAARRAALIRLVSDNVVEVATASGPARIVEDPSLWRRPRRNAAFADQMEAAIG